VNRLLTVALLATICLTSGCATITGTVSGPLTGMIDAPAQTYRANRDVFADYPILFSVDALVMGPFGIVTGPLFGFGKGLSLDIQWVISQVDYSEVFGSYRPTSIWRPFTLIWPTKAPPTEPAPRVPERPAVFPPADAP
jgi:hypothetical protein